MNQMLEEREVKQTPKTYEMNTQFSLAIAGL